MAQLVKDFLHGYSDLMDNRSDPRVVHWTMMSSPLPTLSICLFYVYFAKVLGPKLMENRKPFDLRNTLVLYNFLQTAFSIWLFWEYLQSGWLGHYSFRCQPVDYSDNPLALRMARTCWWYYFSKFTEFLDTMFFILRKKNNHVSNLHVIHHGCMPMSVWIGMKFAAGGHSTFFSLLNTFVHIIMYFYYMVSAMGPEYQKFIWWKKYLTTLQIVQFVLIFVHQFQLLFIDCNYPKGFMVWIGFHGVLFLFLFSDFYKQAYTSKKARRAQKNRITNEDPNGNAKIYEVEAVPNSVTKRTITNGTSNGVSNGHITEKTNCIYNGYSTEFSKNYSNCYSSGVFNGYMVTGVSNDPSREEKTE